MAVAACVVVRNEATYLPEWIAHQKALGFENVIVYDNDSTDLSPTLLARLAELGYVYYHPWPDRQRTNRQVSAYDDAIRRYRKRFHWIAFFDIDEFLVLHQDESVGALMRDYEAFDGLAINWRIFGSSGHTKRERGLVVERFSKCARRNEPANRCIKVIVNPSHIDRCNVHVCYPTGTTIVDENRSDVMKTLVQDGIHASISHRRVQLNHYIIRSWEEWQQKKLRGRGAVSPEQTDQSWDDSRFFQHDLNDETDTSAMQYVGKVRAILRAMGEDLTRTGFGSQWRNLSAYF